MRCLLHTNPNDSVCLYSFSTTVNRLQKCTTDRKLTATALNNLVPAGDTAFYDVLVAVATDHANQTGRQAIIVLTDGDDTASRAKMAEALSRVKQTNIPLYTVGLKSKDLNSAVLRQLAEANGGSYLESPTAPDLRRLYAQIQGQLKNQYRLTFNSLYPERRSGAVSIRLAGKDQVVEASRTYFAPAK